MNGNGLIVSSEKGLRYFLTTNLILATLVFSFVFLINWEDWFFGVKLDGLPAGMYLFIKAISALILAGLLSRVPKYRAATALMSIAFFGFLFVDSAITIQKNSSGRESFSILLALFLLIPVLYLIVCLLSARINRHPQPDISHVSNGAGDSPVHEEREQDLNPVIVIAGVTVALVFVVVILLPVVLSMLAPFVPFIANLGAPPVQDTLITKIMPDGSMAWQTSLAGYSLDLVRARTLPGCGYLMYGTYWISGKPGPVARAINLDCQGNVTWDYSHTLQRNAQLPGTIQSVDPVREGYALKLDTGTVIWLDSQGNIRNNEPGTPTGVSSAAGADAPIGYYPSSLPASTGSIRIRSDNEQGSLFTIEDTLHHKVIQNIYSVNPLPDGGYLVFASVEP